MVTVINARDVRNNWGMNNGDFTANGAAGLNYLNCRWMRLDYVKMASNGDNGAQLAAAMVSSGVPDPNVKISTIIDGYYQTRDSFSWNVQQAALTGYLNRRNVNGSRIHAMLEGPNEFGWTSTQGGGSVAPNGQTQLGQDYEGGQIPGNIRAASVQWSQAIATFKNNNPSLFTGVDIASCSLIDFSGTHGNYGDYNVAQYVDYGNMHFYQNPGAGLTQSNATKDEYNGFKIGLTGNAKDLVMTECGFDSTWGAAQDRISGAWIVLVQFLAFFALGGKRLFWYTMTTGSDDTRSFQWFDGFANGGTLCNSSTAQPRTKAMRNLGTLLSLNNNYADTANFTDTAAFSPSFNSSLFSITGMTNIGVSGNYLILPKSDGSTMIAVWREPVLDNGASNAQSQIPAANTVTLNLGASYSWKLWDPTGGNGGNSRTVTDSPTQINSGTSSSVSVTLYGVPLFVELTSTPVTTVPSQVTVTSLETTATTQRLSWNAATQSPNDYLVKVTEI